MVDHNDLVMDPIVPKNEPGPDGSISSAVSTPDPEAEPLTQDAAQTQKRKGGRKPVRNIFFKSGAPHSSSTSILVSLSYRYHVSLFLSGALTLSQIYATSEERKQRNRQAQAAFRERRTEYIRQLETTIKRNEESLQSLQQSHRSAADECLMLRYKNSLLERILLEKGMAAPILPIGPNPQRLTQSLHRHRCTGRATPEDWGAGRSSQNKPDAP